MPLTILQQDITTMNVDVIVNAANTELLMGGGVCGAIFEAAGVSELQKACDKLSPIQTGHAVITSGFYRKSNAIIHTAGPVYTAYSPETSAQLLSNCYINSLNLAKINNLNSIAFPLISSGIYGYPKDEALLIARNSINEFLLENDMDVYLAIYDKTTFEINNKLSKDIDAYINQTLEVKYDYFNSAMSCETYATDENVYECFCPNMSCETHDCLYEPTQKTIPEPLPETSKKLSKRAEKRAAKKAAKEQVKPNVAPQIACNQAPEFRPSPPRSAPPRPSNSSDSRIAYNEAPKPKASPMREIQKDYSLKNDVLKNLDESFATTLFKIIDEKGKTDVEVYKKANIDRKLFSKIRSVAGYVPRKRTIIALCISLELTIQETNSLLKCAGYALSHSQKFDVIIEYFIINHMYNIFEINEVLFSYDLSLLGS